MTKYPASDKTTSFGKKPHIKKGYYPALLLAVKEFKDKDGNLKEGKFGRQLIFEFAIYKQHPETGAPTEPLLFQPIATDKTLQDVVIPKFVYHQYKNRDSGEFQTAITLNSAITKVLTALGWKFTPEGVDSEQLLNKWVEVNVDDYEAVDGDEKYKASTIKDINPYEGPEPGDVPQATLKEPKKIEKQLKHEVAEPTSVEDGIIASKKAEITKLRNEGLLSEEGYKSAIEQLDAKLEESKKVKG